METTTTTDPKLIALGGVIAAVSDLTAAQCWDRATEKKAAGAANAVVALAKAMGTPITKAEAYKLIDYPEPDAPDPTKPLKGARIVGDHLYSIGGSVGNNWPVAAVRKRKDGTYEFSTGYEAYGYSNSSSFSGYEWKTLQSLHNTEEEALTALKTKYPNARKTQKKDK